MAKGFDKQPGQQGIGDIGAGVGQAMDQFADLSIGIHMGRNPAATNPFQCEQETRHGTSAQMFQGLSQVIPKGGHGNQFGTI